MTYTIIKFYKNKIEQNGILTIIITKNEMLLTLVF